MDQHKYIGVISKIFNKTGYCKLRKSKHGFGSIK